MVYSSLGVKNKYHALLGLVLQDIVEEAIVF